MTVLLTGHSWRGFRHSTYPVDHVWIVGFVTVGWSRSEIDRLVRDLRELYDRTTDLHAIINRIRCRIDTAGGEHGEDRGERVG